MRFNPPPNWPPPPPGWQPPPAWQPPIVWGPPPPGWELWLHDQRPARPSVWSTIGIAFGSAFVLGLPLGPLVAPASDLGFAMGYGVGRLLVPALVIGTLWPFVVPRLSRWFVPLAVFVIGGAFTLLLSAADLSPGSTNAQARATATDVSTASS